VDKFWIIFGFVGQFMFTMRFVVQWIASERAKRSVIPNTFWFFSILGSTILFTYAVYRRDPVFMLGQSFGMIVYFRNIVLIARHKKLSAEAKEVS
jgi:lipid-A-disaccharide synthase-like uncharacterized protein